MDAVADENINDKLALELGRRVVAGTYGAGSKMPGETELSREFSVGRTSVREAMRRLASWGMVLVRPKHKSVVLPKENWQHFDPSVLKLRLDHGQKEAVLRDLGEIRLSVEPSVAYLAASRARPTDIANMAEEINRMADSKKSLSEFAIHDSRFHRAIFKACENQFFFSFFAALEAILPVGISGQAKRDPETTIDEHLKILACIEKHDQDGAKRAMELHLINAREEGRGLFGL